jgi:hypothetical protein
LVRNGPAAAPVSGAPVESGRPSAPVDVQLLQEGKSP